MSGHRAESAVDRHRWLNLLWCPGTHKAVTCSEASHIWSTAKPKAGLKLTRVAWNPWQLCHVDFQVQCQSMHLEIAWEYCPRHELHQNQLKGDLIRDCQPLGRLNHQYYKEKLSAFLKKKKPKTKESCSSSSFLYTRTREMQVGLKCSCLSSCLLGGNALRGKQSTWSKWVLKVLYFCFALVLGLVEQIFLFMVENFLKELLFTDIWWNFMMLPFFSSCPTDLRLHRKG